ncbi:MAG TPA: hypothetical protein VFG58_08450 [Solirubrobacterales bacterium]|nr:hypothetical protein [Solirubrobacterales bacterium]
MIAATSAPLIAVHALAASIWVGGLVAIFIVARAASSTLQPAQRVEFFRALGRSYGIVGTLALLVALATGAILLDGHPWDGLMVAAAVVAGALLLATAAGMAQARGMTRLRRRAVAQVGGEPLDPLVRRGAIVAAVLRACIGVLTLALVVLGAALVN